MDVDLDELIKRANTPNVKIMEYNVSVQPTYLSMGYSVYVYSKRFTYVFNVKVSNLKDSWLLKVLKMFKVLHYIYTVKKQL